METVKQMWEEFAQKVLAPEGHLIGETQYTETRRAFYGGAFCMLGVFNEIGSDKVSEDAGVEHIQKCFEEIMAFYEDVKAGKA